MDIYMFTAMIVLFGLTIVFLSKRDKKKDRHNSNADSTGGSLIDEESSDSGDGGGD